MSIIHIHIVFRTFPGITAIILIVKEVFFEEFIYFLVNQYPGFLTGGG
jgi:hypothetical protein